MSEHGSEPSGRSLAGVAVAHSAVLLAASAVRHVGWWLTWQMRGRPSAASRRLELGATPKR